MMLEKEMEDIAEWLKSLKFRKKWIGGVDEADVWRQIENLQHIYQRIYDEQAAYYQALIDERDQALARLMGRKGGGDAHG